MSPHFDTPRRRRDALGLMAGALAATLGLPAAPAAATDSRGSSPGRGTPDFGPNVTILNPTMSLEQINATLRELATKSTGFDLNRHAVYFMPGTYGSAGGQDDPATATDYLDSPVGFMESIQGLGSAPTDVRINGNLRVGAPGQSALGTFWRSLSNLQINPIQADETAHTMRWNTSQTSILRRVDVTGNLDLTGGLAAGSFIANSRVSGWIDSGAMWVADNPQQQGMGEYFVRDSQIGRWQGRALNFVYSGVLGAPATNFAAPGDKTSLESSPISRDAPFLYIDSKKQFRVFVPAVRTNNSGTNWGMSGRDGRSLSIDEFYIAKPADGAVTINRALARGKNVILTPGVYSLTQPLQVQRPNTVITGMGFATITPTQGTAAIEVGDVPGVVISSVMVANGTKHSDLLVQIGSRAAGKSRSARRDLHSNLNPTTLHDVYVLVGGMWPGSVGTSLQINQDQVLVDNTWLWRADHGADGTVGWTVNPSDTGLEVNGDDVTVLGLFVEHHQKTQVIWNGDRGRTIFMKCEPPYDPPSQAEWMNGSERGYPCYHIAEDVRSHEGIGLATWVFFQASTPVYVHTTIKAPVAKDVRFRSLSAIKIFGSGGIEHVINEFGGPIDSTSPPAFAVSLSAVEQVAAFPIK